METTEGFILFFSPYNMVWQLSSVYYYRGLPKIIFCLSLATKHPNFTIHSLCEHPSQNNLENFFLSNKDSVSDPNTLWAVHKAYNCRPTVYSDNLPNPLTSLQKSHSLPDMEYFKYIQVTHFLIRNPNLHKSVHNKGWLYLLTNTKPTKVITLFYSLFHDKSSFSKLPPMAKLERDIGSAFSNSQWWAALSSNLRSTRSSNLGPHL